MKWRTGLMKESWGTSLPAENVWVYDLSDMIRTTRGRHCLSVSRRQQWPTVSNAAIKSNNPSCFSRIDHTISLWTVATVDWCCSGKQAVKDLRCESANNRTLQNFGQETQVLFLDRSDETKLFRIERRKLNGIAYNEPRWRWVEAVAALCLGTVPQLHCLSVSNWQGQ